MQKKLLYEVSVIRPIVIFLLVVTLALYIYRGWWPQPEGVGYNNLYWWLGNIISGFRMDTIMFVGGYVFGYQCAELGRRQRFGAFAWKKVKRLLLPCYLFSVAYYLLFLADYAHFDLGAMLLAVTDGVKHLWFLPMLFWCFLFGWVTDRLLRWVERYHPAWLNFSGWAMLLPLVLFSLLRFKGLGFGLARVNYYLFYFYLGYWLRRLVAQRAAAGHPWHPGWKLCVLLWVLYLFFLVFRLQAAYPHLPGMPWTRPLWMKGWPQIVVNLLVWCHTTCGILALYATVVGAGSDERLSSLVPRLSRQCYGVYVFHQFFIEWLYYHTSLSAWCCASVAGAWLLPWVVLAVTLLLSIACTQLMLKTRVGRFLIG